MQAGPRGRRQSLYHDYRGRAVFDHLLQHRDRAAVIPPAADASFTAVLKTFHLFRITRKKRENASVFPFLSRLKCLRRAAWSEREDLPLFRFGQATKASQPLAVF